MGEHNERYFGYYEKMVFPDGRKHGELVDFYADLGLAGPASLSEIRDAISKRGERTEGVRVTGEVRYWLRVYDFMIRFRKEYDALLDLQKLKAAPSGALPRVAVPGSLGK